MDREKAGKKCRLHAITIIITNDTIEKSRSRKLFVQLLLFRLYVRNVRAKKSASLCHRIEKKREADIDFSGTRAIVNVGFFFHSTGSVSYKMCVYLLGEERHTKIGRGFVLFKSPLFLFSVEIGEKKELLLLLSFRPTYDDIRDWLPNNRGLGQKSHQ